MAAPEGNEYWKLADWGKPKSYEPIPLWQKFIAYHDWSTSSPWYKNEAIKSGDSAGQLIKIPTERPLTIKGFCIYAEIASQTFYNYEKDEAYIEIITRIREIIYTQKFEGAVVGAFNANIIARDLGLVDKKEEKVTGEMNHTFTGVEIVRPDEEVSPPTQ